MLGRLQQTLIGIRVVKGYHQEAHEDSVFDSINEHLLKQQFKIAKINAGAGPLLEGLGMVAACVGLLVAAEGRSAVGFALEASLSSPLTAGLELVCERPASE